jgi:sugar phosphate isomerase/epimerase
MGARLWQACRMGSVALQMWTVRDRAKADLGATLRELKAIGISTVEAVHGMGGLGAKEVRVQLEKAGISLCAAHARLPESGRHEDVERLCSEIAELGAPAVVVSSLREEHFASDQAVGRAADKMNAAVTAAERLGLEFGYHNHWWEFGTTVGGRPAYEVFVERLDPRIVLEVDTYWAQVGGVDAADLVGSLGERVRYLHVKDGPVDRGSPQCAVGQGRMDVPAVLEANPAVRWFIIELDDFDGDIYDAVRDSLAYLAPLAQ